MADMSPDLKTVLQRMQAEGKSDDEMRSMIDYYNNKFPKQDNKTLTRPTLKPITSEPTDWWGGVGKSLLPGGSASEAAKQGAGGFVKGTFLDMPQNVLSAARAAAATPLDMFSDAVHRGIAMYQDPTNKSNIPGYDAFNTAKQAITNAGSDPEPFGRLMGNVTGQPLLTEGLMRGAPYAGPYVNQFGGMLAEHQPISGVAPKFLEARTARLGEMGVGQGLQAVGNAMSNIPKGGIAGQFTRTMKGEVMPHSPDWTGGNFYREGQLASRQLGEDQTHYQPPNIVPPERRLYGQTEMGSQVSPPGSGNPIRPGTSDLIDRARQMGYDFHGITKDGKLILRQSGS